MIIDAHTHVPLKREDWPRLLAECRWNGVGRFVVSALGTRGWSHVPPPEEVQGANDLAHEFAAFAAGAAVWLVYLNPLHPGCLDELERGLGRGACGIKLWVSLRAEGRGLDACFPVLEAAGRRHLPVLIHTFARTDGNLAGELYIDDFAFLARRFPQVQMVAAHAGGNWRLSLGALRGLPNAHVDICGMYPDQAQARSLVDDLGPDRVLFGSDMLGRSLPAQMAKVAFAGLSAREKRLLLRDNAARVFGISVPANAGEPRLPVPLQPPALALPDPREDHFCFTGRWPFFETPCPTPVELDRALAAAGIAKAFTGDLAAFFTVDLRQAHRDFGAAVAGCSRIVPLATLNPRSPNALRLLDEAVPCFHRVLVSPYLHTWRLDDPGFRPFFQGCSERHAPVWINAGLCDHRFLPTGVAWRPVSAAELTGFLRTAPANDYVVQGVGLAEIETALRADGVCTRVRFEIARLSDFTGHLESAFRAFGPNPFVFGAEFPFRDLCTVRWVAGVQAGAGAPGLVPAGRA